MSTALTEALITRLPKAELHLHLEGSLRPATVVELAARHGERVTPQEVEARYRYSDFHGFLEAYKWVTSFLRTPADYALATERLTDELLAQNVVYAEVTLSAGVMLWRNQDADANLLAIHEAGLAAKKRGLRMQWIPDATRQFGADAAMAVAQHAARCKPLGVVAFGMGGDELSIPAEQFRPAFEYAAGEGLHRVSHAGEIGGPEEVRAAVELLGAERIGHGIAAMHDPLLRQQLRFFGTVLEICPTSNLRTAALAKQLGRANAGIEDHPLRLFFAEGVTFAISTDDPAMFHTSLNQEYSLLLRLGFTIEDVALLAALTAFRAFLPAADQLDLGRRIQSEAAKAGIMLPVSWL
jgi:adenosine deaminase